MTVKAFNPFTGDEVFGMSHINGFSILDWDSEVQKDKEKNEEFFRRLEDPDELEALLKEVELEMAAEEIDDEELEEFDWEDGDDYYDEEDLGDDFPFYEDDEEFDDDDDDFDDDFDDEFEDDEFEDEELN